MLGLSNQALSNLLYWVTRKRWLIFAFAISLFLFYVPSPETLSPEGHRTLIIVVIAIILIVGEVIPLPAVAILILILEVILGIDTPNGVANSFMSDAVFFIMGSLMLAVAIVSQGLDKRLALGIIKMTGNKTWRIVFGFVSISAILSSFIGEHTVAAMMLPVALTLVRNTSTDQKVVHRLATLLLFSIAYGCAMGSIGTPSGGGRNVIMIGYFSEFGLGNISYLDWIKYAYPMLLLEIPIAVLILWMTFKPNQTILDSAVRKLKVNVTKAGKMTGNQVMAILIFVAVFLGWVFLSPYLGLGIIALIGVFLYLSFGLIEWKDINRNTNWGVIILFGAAISLGIQMKETGAAEWVANQSISIMSMLVDDIGFMRWFISVFLTGLLTNILSNAATVAVLGPVVLDMGGNPIILGLATSIASAFAYLTIVASPTCMIIHSSGLVKSSDYLKAGWKLFIMSMVLLFIISNFYWPYLS
ncbi:MAG: anion transporter [Candidatus Marinimicrobia bacterium]|jgi:sodium-dependent dicarboxylate transporter 2/3/5|nr:anion transporter [Candidatus Neomarinimicrobiota bacterium]MDP6276594.1 DASS family sodium-coupled anion symporter [Candidatus Neomarinimicrobiota bacterium]MDP7216978.1 DASS family sodium-coupled anion symporter [Candidatus Neomarinimicrobiota bacterium]HBN45482.1 anion transporter [Candidatus Neomarinimicrobiota bacterium]HJL74891.1 DASS family sodium-coupled anion symporter [Candidatus Neomarinimicrobiota bacterium]|tara:strand:- start:3029 stop:4444 length:1416 start_codon:yes stop_codon:yes gene_type:complete